MKYCVLSSVNVGLHSMTLYAIVLFMMVDLGAFARSTITVTGTAGGTSAIKVATPWLYFSLNSKGTLGNGTTNPGLQLSPTGNGVYGADMVSPGGPREGFSVSGRIGTTSFTHSNDNSGVYDIRVSSWSAYVQAQSREDVFHATWTGSTSQYTLTISYSVRASVPQIHISTTVTSNSSISDLSFLRAVDPDQGGTYNTRNVCGYGSLFSPNTFVSSLGEDGNTAFALFTTMTPGKTVQRINAAVGATTVSAALSATPSIESHLSDSRISLVFLIGNVSGTRRSTITYCYGLAQDLAALQSNGALLNFEPTPSSQLSLSLTTTDHSSSLAKTNSGSNSALPPTVTHTATGCRESQTVSKILSVSSSVATLSPMHSLSPSKTKSNFLTTSPTSQSSASEMNSLTSSVLQTTTDSNTVSMSYSASSTKSNSVTRSPLWSSSSNSDSQTMSLPLSPTCNPAPVDLRRAFLTSQQSTVALVRAQIMDSAPEGALLLPLIITSGVAESINSNSSSSQVGSTTFNFTIHLFSDNTAGELDVEDVLLQTRSIALSIQNYATLSGNNATAQQESNLLSVDCAWDGFGSLATAPFIACRMFNVANAVNRFADVKLQVNLVLGCDQPRSTIPVGLTLLARPIPLEAVAQVVSGTSSATSILTGNGVAGASAARSSATLRVMSCSNPGADGAGSGGLFSLYLGDGPLAASRGALASTAVVTIAVFLVALGVAFILNIQSPEVTFRGRCTQLYIPSYPMLIFLIFGPTVISSGMSLVAYDVATPGDISIGVVALVIVALTLLYSLWQVLFVAPKEIYAKPVVDSNKNDIETPTSRWNITKMFRRAHKKHHRWALRDNSSSNKGNGVVQVSTSSATRPASGIVPVVADYRILWFFVFELASNLLAGAVAGAPGLDGNSHLSQSVCLVLTSSMLLCNLVQLGVCVALRPTSSIFMQVYTIYVLVLSCAMCASIVAFLVFVDAANGAPAASATKVRNTDHASIAALGTVYFSLLVGASTTVKALIDGWNIACFLWHSCGSFRMRRTSSSQDALNHTDDDDDDDPFSALQVDDDASFDDGEAMIDVVDLNPTDECGDVFAMDSKSAFSDDPLRELFNYSFVEDRGSDEADP